MHYRMVLTIALLVCFIGGQIATAALLPSIPSPGSSRYTLGTRGDLSPVNPEYTQYREEDTYVSRGSDHHALGYIPPPIDLSHTAGSSIQGDGSSVDGGKGPALRRFSSATATTTGTGILASELPARYDLRLYGRTPPVRDQGLCSCCWAFSSLTSLESSLLGRESWNFSENSLKNLHGFDYSPCSGGNPVMATAYFARWSGPVSGRDDPYIDSDRQSPTDLPALKHVQNVFFLPPRTDPLDNSNVKYALMHYGAVATAIRWVEDYYLPARASYYDMTLANPNHAVTIVGWDDRYPAENFAAHPPGDGAFLVQNSWGSGWGNKGFFYVSYYDPQIGRTNTVFTAEPVTNYDRIYQYDPLGWILNIGLGGENATFANVFTAESDGVVSAVSFYNPGTKTRYEASIRTDPTNGPMGGSAPAGVTSGTIHSPGYHTIPVYPEVKVREGQKFAVIVSITTPDYWYPVAVEYPLDGFSSSATAEPGQSYVSSDGITWIDLTTIYPNTNVCLKAFGRDSGPLTLVLPTLAVPDRKTTSGLAPLYTGAGTAPVLAVSGNQSPLLPLAGSAAIHPSQVYTPGPAMPWNGQNLSGPALFLSGNVPVSLPLVKVTTQPPALLVPRVTPNIPAVSRPVPLQ